MEDKLAELRRRLDEKTTEIEAFIAREQGMGDIRAMSPADMSSSRGMWRNCLSNGKRQRSFSATFEAVLASVGRFSK
jgi:phage-related protein